MTRSQPRSHAQPRRRTAHWTARGLGAALALLAATAALAAGGDDRAAVEARYQAERRACLDGRSGQDSSSCLKEAGAARAEALRHRLGNGDDTAALRANALARCAVQPAADRPACETLARGQGTASGSVRGGGVIKETVTRSVGANAAPPAAGASRPAPLGAGASGG